MKKNLAIYKLYDFKNSGIFMKKALEDKDDVSSSLLPTHPPTHLPTYLLIHFYTHPSIHQSVHPPTHSFICPPTYSSHPPTHPLQQEAKSKKE